MKKEDKGISRRSFLKAASSVGISAVSTTPFSEAHASPLRAPSAEYGREKIARIIHRLTALLFLIMAIPFVAVQLAHIRNWAIWPENRWSLVALFDGIKGLWVNYISFGHVRIGKFNVGQKLFAWTMIVAITAITASGFVLMFRDLFTQGIQEFCCFAHAASFVVIGVFLIVHLQLSLLPMNRQSLNAMFEDGRLPIDYVKSHHPIWYEKLTGKRPEQTSAEKVGQLVTDEELTTS